MQSDALTIHSDDLGVRVGTFYVPILDWHPEISQQREALDTVKRIANNREAEARWAAKRTEEESIQ